MNLDDDEEEVKMHWKTDYMKCSLNSSPPANELNATNPPEKKNKIKINVRRVWEWEINDRPVTKKKIDLMQRRKKIPKTSYLFINYSTSSHHYYN